MLSEIENKISYKTYKLFESNGECYMYITDFCGLYKIDKNILKMLDEEGKTIEEVYIDLSANLNKDEINAILKNMEEFNLVKYDTKENTNLVVQKKPLIGITLMICQDCNMRCSYCFAGDGQYQHKGYMDIEVGKKAIDFLIENCDGNELTVCLFGGEPLLHFDLFKELVEYCDEQKKKTNKQILITTTINGTLLTDEIEDYLLNHNITVQLSMDGDEDTHNSNRYFANKVGSYKSIIKKTKTMREKGLLSARATVTKNNLDIVSIFNHLYDLNFRAIPIVPAFNQLVQEDMGNIKDAYDKAINYFEGLIKDNHITKANKMTIFRNALDRIHYGRDRDIACGVGNGSIAVDISGNIFPCHRFVSEEEYKIGDIYDGFKNRDQFIDSVNVENIEECSQCWAKSLCTGGCPKENIENQQNKDLNKFDICELNKFVYEKLVETYLKLTEDEKKKIFIRRKVKNA